MSDTHNGFAVLGKGVFDKHGPESKAQGAVGVTDTQLPAWSTALQQQQQDMLSNKFFLDFSALLECLLFCEIGFVGANESVSSGHLVHFEEVRIKTVRNETCELLYVKTSVKLQQSENRPRTTFLINVSCSCY